MKRKLEYRWMLWCGIWAVVTLLAACDHLAKPSSSGRPYEVLVVVGDSLWQRPAGRALFDVLDTDIPGLPQPERSFRISQTDPQRFNQVLNIFRNIIKVDIAPNQYTQTKMKFTRDVYAQPQVVLTIQSPNEKDFAAFVQKNAQSIIDFLVKMEMNRQINELEKNIRRSCYTWPIPSSVANFGHRWKSKVTRKGRISSGHLPTRPRGW